MAKYFACPDDKGKPEILYKLNEKGLTEEIYIPGKGWQPGYFLDDVLFGSGDVGAITEKEAREAFEAEAFA